jgi:molecular chaperone DnaJ
MELYEALGVKRGASVAEIRRAWQRLSRALHPALNPGDPAAAERYREAAKAFEVLSDPQRRAAYDRGERPPVPVSPVAQAGFEGFDFSARVRVEAVGFRDIFDEPQGPHGREQALQGEDLEQATRLSFEESMSGAERRVHLVRFEVCPGCSGSGDVAFGPVRCQRCQGSGLVRGSRGHMIFSRTCAECDGTGEIRSIDCPRCGGEGRAIASEWIDVQIPKGVDDGSHVRLPGAGNAGRRGGPAGDFVLTIQLEPHARFRRDGEDLHCTVDVGLFEAAMGAHVEVATPDGPVTIEVPAGTQNGQRFRLRKRGVPHLGAQGRGDLWVEARIVVPAVTGERGRALLRELRALVASEAPVDGGEGVSAAGSPERRS